VLEALLVHRRGNEVDGRGEVHRRAAGEESRGIRRQRVPAILLGKEADYRQIVTENSQAALGRRAALGQRGNVACAFPNRGEDVQVNGSLHRGGALITGCRLHEKLRRELLVLSVSGHGQFLPAGFYPKTTSALLAEPRRAGLPAVGSP